MVFFTCNGCGEPLKKKSVENHNYRCRTSQGITCIDCHKIFGADYVSHISCISEQEKYGGRDFIPKVNKGQKKQDEWMETLQNLAKDFHENPQLRNILNQAASVQNVPRNRKKFQNFLSNQLRINPYNAEKFTQLIFSKIDALNAEKPPPLPVEQKEETKKRKQDDDDEESLSSQKKKTKPNDEDKKESQVEMENVAIEDKVLEKSKKKKKSKRKEKTEESVEKEHENADDVATKENGEDAGITEVAEMSNNKEINGKPDIEESNKKERKKSTSKENGFDNSEENKENSSEDGIRNTENTFLKKETLEAAVGNVNESSEQIQSTTASEFKWKSSIKKALKANESKMKLKKLEKFVVKEYLNSLGNNSSETEAKELFKIKINNDKFIIEDKYVKLK